MMKQLLFLALSVGIIACQSPQEKSMEKIQQLENQLVNDYQGVVDADFGKQMIDAYLGYTNQFETDSNTVDYLFKAAEVCQGIGDYEQSLELFSKIKTDFADNKKAPAALFLVGFITDTYLNSPEAAKKSYQEFIRKYPNHELAKDARILLEQMGLDDINLIREFQ